MLSLSGRLVMLSPPGAGELICPCLELCTSLGDTLTPAADMHVSPPRTQDQGLCSEKRHIFRRYPTQCDGHEMMAMLTWGRSREEQASTGSESQDLSPVPREGRARRTVRAGVVAALS